jgi:hypothetical protein
MANVSLQEQLEVAKRAKGETLTKVIEAQKTLDDIKIIIAKQRVAIVEASAALRDALRDDGKAALTLAKIETKAAIRGQF